MFRERMLKAKLSKLEAQVNMLRSCSIGANPPLLSKIKVELELANRLILSERHNFWVRIAAKYGVELPDKKEKSMWATANGHFLSEGGILRIRNSIREKLKSRVFVICAIVSAVGVTVKIFLG